MVQAPNSTGHKVSFRDLWPRYKSKVNSFRAWKSLETVRKMHVVVNRRSTKAGEGIISQKDMSITLFTFMGFHLLMPEKFGIVGTREQFEAFNHFWRVIGHMLGTDDKYTCCADSLDETLRRLESIKEDILIPSLLFPAEKYESYTKIAVDGMWHSEPILHYGQFRKSLLPL
jgi:ER-bound oxygenase mpaB/B'/Rubber oxygenase, catalytic domain